MKLSAAARTPPLFDDFDWVPDVLPTPKKLSMRTLRKRVIDAALALHREDGDFDDNIIRLREAAQALDERIKQG